jgi:hypothetical protein
MPALFGWGARKAAVIAASAVVVLTGVGVAVPLLSGGKHQSPQSAGAPSPLPSPTSPLAPRPSGTPSSPTSSPSVAHHVVAERASASPTTSPLGRFALHATVAAHYDAGSSPDYPATVVDVHFTGYVRDNFSGIFSFEGVPGNPPYCLDYATCMAFGKRYQNVCPKGDEHPSVYKVDTVMSFRYHYRTAGTYRLALLATDDCYDVIDDGGNLRVQQTVIVTHSSTRSNGPERPVVSARNEPSVKDGRITVLPNVDDPDGYIRTVSMDWGDGGPPSVTQYPNSDEPAKCADHHGADWPQTQFLLVNETSPTMPPGDYLVKMTVTSSGCDGKDEQAVTKTWTVQVP